MGVRVEQLRGVLWVWLTLQHVESLQFEGTFKG